MAKFKLLHDLYRFPGFVPLPRIRGVFGDPRRWSSPSSAAEKNGLRGLWAGVSQLLRQAAAAGPRSLLWRQTCLSRLPLRRVQCSRCGGVKNEGLDWLADNPLYTKRFAFFVGRRCRQTTIKEVAEELYLDWHAVKELDKQYMREQLRRAGNPAPRVIGIDEIAIAKGHNTASWSATWSEAGPSGSAARTAPRRAWTSSLPGLGPKNAAKSAWRSWTCGRRSATPPSRKGNAPQATICTTSSTS